MSDYDGNHVVRMCAALLVMARDFNIPSDILGLLTLGDEALGVPPGALKAGITEYCKPIPLSPMDQAILDIQTEVRANWKL